MVSFSLLWTKRLDTVEGLCGCSTATQLYVLHPVHTHRTATALNAVAAAAAVAGCQAAPLSDITSLEKQNSDNQGIAGAAKWSDRRLF